MEREFTEQELVRRQKAEALKEMGVDLVDSFWTTLFYHKPLRRCFIL